MNYAQKFNERGEADIKLVWEEWFWDSLDFGGACDSFYSIDLIVDMSLARAI